MRLRRCLNVSSMVIFEYKVFVRFFLGEIYWNKNIKFVKFLF